MEKTSKFLAFLLVLFTCCTFIACGDDDDSDDNGSSAGDCELRISGQSPISGFDYAYCSYYDEKNTTSKNEVWCTLAFYTYDYLSYTNGTTELPATMSKVTVDILAGEKVPSELPTGNFFLENMKCYVNCTSSNGSGGTQYEDDQSYEGKVSISKSGSMYKVNVSNVKLYLAYNYDNAYEASFSFKGNIEHVSDWDN